jgi:predicted XRE-type DNA-binding protein
VEDEIAITRGSGNVYLDLGFPNANEELAKAGIVREIGKILKERGLTQAQAAEILHINQPKVSALLRGHTEGYSIERLLRFLLLLDRDVEILVKPREPGAPAQIKVAAVGAE